MQDGRAQVGMNLPPLDLQSFLEVGQCGPGPHCPL